MAAKKKAPPKFERSTKFERPAARSSPEAVVARLVDELYQKRETRYALQHEAKALEDREKEIRRELIAELPRFGATGVAGKVARAQLDGRTIAVVEDWDALRKYIKKKDAWDLLQKRITDEAARARWDEGEAIPGLKPERVTTISLHKV